MQLNPGNIAFILCSQVISVHRNTKLNIIASREMKTDKYNKCTTKVYPTFRKICSIKLRSEVATNVEIILFVVGT